MKTTEWNMGQLMELATGYWKSALLSAAVELKIFEALADAPLSADALAAHLALPERHLSEILDALTALGLLTKQGEAYAIAASADALVNPRSDTCILDALRFNMDLYPLWGKLAEAVRNGAPALPPGAHLGADPARTRRFAMGMHSRAMGIAPAILPALPLDGITTLLDVAAGPGTFSRLLAEQHAHLNVTQFDLPPVLDVARELTESSPARERIELRPGNYHEDDLPTGFDAALLCGAIHQEDDDTAATLFARIRAALKPGGHFLLVDMMLDPDRSGPLFSNLFSINMMLTSPRGRVFTAQQLLAHLESTGFIDAALIQPPRSPYWIIHARNAP